MAAHCALRPQASLELMALVKSYDHEAPHYARLLFYSLLL